MKYPLPCNLGTRYALSTLVKIGLIAKMNKLKRGTESFECFSTAWNASAKSLYAKIKKGHTPPPTSHEFGVRGHNFREQCDRSLDIHVWIHFFFFLHFDTLTFSRDGRGRIRGWVGVEGGSVEGVYSSHVKTQAVARAHYEVNEQKDLIKYIFRSFPSPPPPPFTLPCIAVANFVRYFARTTVAVNKRRIQFSFCDTGNGDSFGVMGWGCLSFKKKNYR